MRYQEHCDESIKLFGKPYGEVHSWLDEFAARREVDGRIAGFNAHHRLHRHHLAGCEQVRTMWGDDAYNAAVRHVKSDLVRGEGMKESEEIPLDENDYIKKGFY